MVWFLFTTLLTFFFFPPSKWILLNFNLCNSFKRNKQQSRVWSKTVPNVLHHIGIFETSVVLMVQLLDKQLPPSLDVAYYHLVLILSPQQLLIYFMLVLVNLFGFDINLMLWAMNKSRGPAVLVQFIKGSLTTILGTSDSYMCYFYSSVFKYLY